ncbi:DUF1992 domain-containing protein [Paenibacillus aurantiacus]|uniref:DUF1992 domain-containing protein n=1 Tax=Paenibacillus aurantiacus TaxID=1936118 RepID=A0ABV5KYX9_9BACL
MDIFRLIAEERIREAMKNGDFEHFDGKGKPLMLEDLSHVPEELRMSYKILRNSGYLPPEMQLTKEIVSLQELLALCTSEEEREPVRSQLNEKRLRYRMMAEAKGLYDNAAFAQYEHLIKGKLEGDDRQ